MVNAYAIFVRDEVGGIAPPPNVCPTDITADCRVSFAKLAKGSWPTMSNVTEFAVQSNDVSGGRRTVTLTRPLGSDGVLAPCPDGCKGLRGNCAEFRPPDDWSGCPALTFDPAKAEYYFVAAVFGTPGGKHEQARPGNTITMADTALPSGSARKLTGSLLGGAPGRAAAARRLLNHQQPARDEAAGSDDDDKTKGISGEVPTGGGPAAAPGREGAEREGQRARRPCPPRPHARKTRRTLTTWEVLQRSCFTKINFLFFYPLGVVLG
eukprot:gene2545-9980_t